MKNKKRSKIKEDFLSVSERAYRINQNPSIYGTFAEIGAGQEVARHFFQVGQASNTIAKTMSAYDMTFSDTIYGKGERYVSLARLKNMLDHEFKLLQNRLKKKRAEDTCFFTFADTVTTSTHRHNISSVLSDRENQGLTALPFGLPSHTTSSSSCQGWMGIRFQLRPHGSYNDVILHVRMLDHFRLQQQEALGVLGVNLIYSAFYLLGKNKPFVPSLVSNLHKNRLEIDFLKLEGRDLVKWNHHEVNLDLVKHGLTEAIIFGPYDKRNKSKKNSFQLDEALYNKSIFIIKNDLKTEKSLNPKNGLELLKKAYKKHQLLNKKKTVLASSFSALHSSYQKKSLKKKSLKAKKNQIKNKKDIIQLVEIRLKPNQKKSSLFDKKIFEKIEKLNQLKLSVLVTAFPFSFHLKNFLRRYTQTDIVFLMSEVHLKDIFIQKKAKERMKKIIKNKTEKKVKKETPKHQNQNLTLPGIHFLKVLNSWFDDQTFFYIFHSKKEIKEMKGKNKTKNETKVKDTKSEKEKERIIELIKKAEEKNDLSFLSTASFPLEEEKTHLFKYLLACNKIFPL